MGGPSEEEGTAPHLKFNPMEISCRVCTHDPTPADVAAADYRFTPECRNIIAMLTGLTLELVRLLELTARGFGTNNIHDI